MSRLTAAGLPVLARVTVDQVAAAAGARGPALSLHLATIIGVVALLLAASVLAVAVATSGRVRAHDLAGLRVVGVPAATVRRAAVREQLAVAVAGVVAGAVLGAAGAALTLSRGGVDRTLPAPDLASGVASVVVALAVSVVVLAGVCWALGARLGRQARPTLLREGRAMKHPGGRGRLVGLRLALRGIAYRRLTAVVVLVLAVVAATAAVVAPLYSRAAEESIARGALARSDVFARAVHADVSANAARVALPASGTIDSLGSAADARRCSARRACRRPPSRWSTRQPARRPAARSRCRCSTERGCATTS